MMDDNDSLPSEEDGEGEKSEEEEKEEVKAPPKKEKKKKKSPKPDVEPQEEAEEEQKEEKGRDSRYTLVLKGRAERLEDSLANYFGDLSFGDEGS